MNKFIEEKYFKILEEWQKTHGIFANYVRTNAIMLPANKELRKIIDDAKSAEKNLADFWKEIENNK